MPGAPTLTATAGYRSIVLTWTAPSENGGSALTPYKIQRLNDDNQWINRTSVPSNAITWRDTGLSDSKTYHYRIFATNAVGDSADWGSASALTLANPVEEPGPPVGTNAEAGHGMVTLTWNEPVFNGGAAVTEYRYRYQKDDSNNWTGWMSSGTDREVEIENLEPGVTYDFQVVAVNSAGVSDAAEDDAEILPTAPTAAPTQFTVSLGRDSGNANREQVTITWKEVTANGGATIADTTGYVLQWKADDGDWMTDNISDVTVDGLDDTKRLVYHPPSSGGSRACTRHGLHLSRPGQK